MKRQRCKVCGTFFDVVKEKVYWCSGTGKASSVYEAMDCPTCGCQKLLDIRFLKEEELHERTAKSFPYGGVIEV